MDDARQAGAGAFAEADHQEHLLHGAVAAIADAACQGLLQRYTQNPGIAETETGWLLDHQNGDAPGEIGMHQGVHQGLAQGLVRRRVVLPNATLQDEGNLDF